MNWFFRYLWFVIIVTILILALRLMGEADRHSHGIPPEHSDVR